MKFTVNPQLLHEALSEVAKATGNAKTFPVLGGIKIEAEPGKLRLTATDLEITISRAIAAEVAEGGAGVVPAKQCADVVSRLVTLDSLSLAWDTAKTSVRLTWPRGKAQFAGFAAADFPDAVQAIGEPVITLPAQRWRDILRRTVFATADDKTRPYLTGVSLVLTGGILTATATDAVRIAHLRREIPATAIPYNVILSAAGIKALLAILPDGAEPANLYDSANSVIFVCGDRMVAMRKLDGQYPDIMRLVPQQYEVRAIANRRNLLEAITRAVVAAPKDRAIKLEITMGALTVSAANDADAADDAVDADTPGLAEPFVIGFNAAYITEALRVMNQDDVTLQFAGARNPACILDGGDEAFQYIALPLIQY